MVLTVTDELGSSAEYSSEINITPINDPPSIVLPNQSGWLPVWEGDSQVKLRLEDFGLAGTYYTDLNGGQAGISDSDSPPDKVRITVESLPGKGSIYKNGIKMDVGATFSLQDVIDGKITYSHNGADVSPTTGDSDSFAFSVNDGGGTLTVDDNSAPLVVNIRLQPVNDPFDLSSTNDTDAEGNLILWAWERQTGTALAAGQGGSLDVIPGGGLVLDLGDDLPANIKITFSNIVLPADAVLYYMKNGVTRTVINNSDSITADQLQYLRYDAGDAEPKDMQSLLGQRWPSFDLEITDRYNVTRGPGVDDSRDGFKTGNYTVVIRVADNNDDPTLPVNSGPGTGNALIDEGGQTKPGTNTRPTVGQWTNSGSDFLTITSEMLRANDVDSSRDGLTYTLSQDFSTQSKLWLMLNVGGSWYRLSPGHSFTQADLDAGRVAVAVQGSSPAGDVWLNDGTNDYFNLDAAFKFTVTDGGYSSWQDSARPGGIYGDYPGNANNPYTPGLREGDLLKINFNVSLKVIKTTGSGITPPTLHAPEVTVNQPGRIIEYDPLLQGDQSADRFDDNSRNSYSFALNGLLVVSDQDSTNDCITVTLSENCVAGSLMVLRGGEWVQIFKGQNFTYQEVLDGQVRYFHSGDEIFQDSLKFIVSDGFSYVTDTTGSQPIELLIDIRPYNDAPELEVGKVELSEEGTAVIDTGVIQLYDRDAPPDTNDSGDPYYPKYDQNDAPRSGDFEADDLYLVITKLPDTNADPLKVAGGLWIKENGVTWRQLTAADFVSGEIVLESKYLDNGWIEYRHTGNEVFTDSITVFVRDGSTELGGPRDSEPKTINFEIAQVNDRPVLINNDPVKWDHGNENSTVTIWGNPDSGGNPGDPRLYVEDPDNAAREIAYTLVSECQYGVLLLNGVAISKGATFYQSDIDAGRLSYRSDGKNHHVDSFKFEVSDCSLYADGGAAHESHHGSGIDGTHVFEIDLRPVNEKPGLGGMNNVTVIYQRDSNPVSISDPSGGLNQYLKISDPDMPSGYDPLVTHLYDKMQLTMKAEWSNSAFGKFGLSGGKTLADFNLTEVSANTTGSWVVTGTLADLNAFLEYLTYTSVDSGNNVTDLNDVVNLTFRVDDLGNGAPDENPVDSEHHSGRADNLFAEKKLEIYVSVTNDPVNITGNHNGLELLEDANDAFIFIQGSSNQDLQFDDLDAYVSTNNKVTIWVNEGSIAFVGGLPAGVTYTPVTNSDGHQGLELTGSIAGLNKALYQLKYVPDADFNGAAKIYLTYDDAGNTGFTDTATHAPGGSYPGDAEANWADATYYHNNLDGTVSLIVGKIIAVTVIPVNDKPELVIDPDDFLHFQDDGADRNLPTFDLSDDSTHTGGYYEVKIGDKLDISDAKDFPPNDSAISNIDGRAVTLTVSAAQKGGGSANGYFVGAGGQNLSALNGATVSGEGGAVITITGKWSEVQAVLKQLAYAVNDSVHLNVTDKITITIDDKGNGAKHSDHWHEMTDTKVVMVDISLAADSAPVISGGNLNFYEDLHGRTDAEKSKGVNLNTEMSGGLSVADGDIFDRSVFYEIYVDGTGGQLLKPNGSLFAKDGSPVKVGGGGLTPGDADWYAAGASVAELNAILAGLTFKPDANFNSSTPIKVTILVDDKGNLGSVNPLSYTALPSDRSLWVDGQTYVVDHGNGVYGLATVKVIEITVGPVNDRPTSSSSESTLPQIGEGTAEASLPKNTVQNLFGGYFADPNDSGAQKGTFAGILVSGNASTDAQGTWQYSTDGTNWTDIPNNASGNIGESQALYLEAGTKIRFKPSGSYYGDVGKLTVHLAENTSVAAPECSPFPTLSNGSTYDLSATGGDYNNTPLANRPYSTAVTLATEVIFTNDAPVVNGSPITALEDRYLDLTAISISDPDMTQWPHDSNNPSVKYALSLSVTKGVLYLYDTDGTTLLSSGPSLNFNDTFDNINALLASGLIKYKANADYYGPDSLTVTVNDQNHGGAGAGALSDQKDFTITVTPVNDAPGIDGSGASDGDVLSPFAPIDDSGTPTTGETVANIFGQHYEDSTDKLYNGLAPDDADQHTFAGVLVVGNLSTAAEGHWQCSTDGGATWAHVPPIGSGQAFFLPGSAQLRFQPATGFSGQPGQLQVRLADKTYSSSDFPDADLVAAPAETGGETAFSDGRLALTVQTTFANDPPVINSPPIAATEDRYCDLSMISISDYDMVERPGDSNDPTIQYTLTLGGVGHGTLYLFDAGGNIINSGPSLTLTGTFDYINGLLAGGLVKYKAETDYYGPDSLTVTVGDGGHGGQGTPLSDNKTIAITVDPANDAPLIAGGAADGDVLTPFAPVEENGGPSGGLSVGTIFGPHYEDSTDKLYNGPPDVSNQHSFGGVLVVGDLSTAAEGHWQYSLDGGASWADLPAVGSGQGFFLPENAELRFNPAENFNGRPGRLEVRLMDKTYDPALYPAGQLSALPAETGGETAFSDGRLGLSLTVTAVNSAPSLEGDSEITLPGRPQNQPPDGFTVADLLGDLFNDENDRVGGIAPNDLQGLMVVGSLADPATEGVWQYWTGSDWADLNSAALGLDSAVYLEAGSRIRFLPAGDFDGRPGELVVRLVESDEARTGLASGLASGGLAVGGVYDLSGPGFTGGRSHVGDQDISLSFSVKADQWIPHHPHQDHPNHPDWESRWRGLEVPPYVREGLDSPQHRSGRAMDGQSQEATLITDLHISTAVNQAHEICARSINYGTEMISLSSTRPADGPQSPDSLNLQLEAGGQAQDGVFPLNNSAFAQVLSGGPLSFQATLIGGRELPPWLIFDREKFALLLLDPSQLTNPLDVIIMATDAEGQQAVMNVRLNPVEAEAAATGEEPNESPEEAVEEPAGDQKLSFLEGEGRQAVQTAEALPRDADFDDKMLNCGPGLILKEAERFLQVLGNC